MTSQDQDPIFVHSLFRAGSTYLFNVFRRSPAGYWCYQEPLNEKLMAKALQPDGFTVGPQGASTKLRHPNMDKPHSYEFHVVADVIKTRFRPEFSYRLFFSEGDEEMHGVNHYFAGLQQGAQGRPVFQCCRTTGRVRALKQAFAGKHILLWRNPWDQWWSYKNDHYFDSRNLFISGASHLPPFIKLIKQKLGIPPLVNVSEEGQNAFFSNRRLSAHGSYALFYALWCHAMLEAQPHCDMDISIDALSSSEAYRAEIIKQLDALAITGIDFSDCAVPQTQYGEWDARFFADCEEHVYQALLQSGYQAQQIDTLRSLGAAREAAVIDTSLPQHSAVRDAMRAREHALTMETELSAVQSQLFNTRNKIQQREQNTQAAAARGPNGAKPVKH